MKALSPLPVMIPKVANQRWSCHCCGNCCRTLVIHITDEERKRIDGQGWKDRLGIAPCVRVGRGWALNKREDGSCVFLDENTRCRIHAGFGERDKPLACRIYPFSARPVRGGWQASIRFDCPSIVSSKGEPLGQHRPWLTDLVKGLDHHRHDREDGVLLQRGVHATVDEVDMVIGRFGHWIRTDKLVMADRLIGAARITTTLARAKFKKVRASRFAELLDLLFSALPGECTNAPAVPAARQQGMLRQVAFAHGEHATLAEMRSGPIGRFGKRWRQLHSARHFLKGRTGDQVPQLPGLSGITTFGTVESVGPAIDSAPEITGLIRRYLTARLEGRSVFGSGYYNWPVFYGLAALWLSVAATGWLARYTAALEDRSTVSLDSAGHALGLVDRAAARVPALGTMTERTRVSYLLADDGIARLINHYALLSEPQ